MTGLNADLAREAAQQANKLFQQWMPERWLNLFIDSYNDIAACRTARPSDATGYLYTEQLPFNPGPGVRVRREPEPLYALPPDEPARVTPSGEQPEIHSSDGGVEMQTHHGAAAAPITNVKAGIASGIDPTARVTPTVGGEALNPKFVKDILEEIKMNERIGADHRFNIAEWEVIKAALHALSPTIASEKKPVQAQGAIYPDSDDPRDWAKVFCDRLGMWRRTEYGNTVDIGDQVGIMERWFAAAMGRGGKP